MKKNKTKTAYLIGIKGVGMTMLAQTLVSLNYKVIGSDVIDTFLTDKALKRSKIKVLSPYSIENIYKEADLIVYSSAALHNNIELDYILKNKKLFKKSRILSYAQALGEIFNKYNGLAVCGSHGKTTVSAWLGFTLKSLDMSPKVLVGSYVYQFKGATYIGNSKFFIAEVDEYQNKLQYFKPNIVVLNNIDFDHPDYFKTKKDYIKVFADFIKKIPKTGYLIANFDDPQVFKLAKTTKAKVISYAIESKEKVDLRASKIEFKNLKQSFLVNEEKFSTKLLGKYNVSNALAVLATLYALKIDLKKAKKILANFAGTSRRFELKGYFKNIPVYDDYAHHPSEVKAVLKAFKDMYPKKRIVCVFHPHTFSRTKALINDFAQSFFLCDLLGVLEIYPSAREKKIKLSSLDLIAEIKTENKKKNFKQSIKYLKDFDQSEVWLKKNLKKDDVLILLGAGDIFRVADRLLKN